jgi:hypothetical protein
MNREGSSTDVSSVNRLLIAMKFGHREKIGCQKEIFQIFRFTLCSNFQILGLKVTWMIASTVAIQKLVQSCDLRLGSEFWNDLRCAALTKLTCYSVDAASTELRMFRVGTEEAAVPEAAEATAVAAVGRVAEAAAAAATAAA